MAAVVQKGEDGALAGARFGQRVLDDQAWILVCLDGSRPAPDHGRNAGLRGLDEFVSEAGEMPAGSHEATEPAVERGGVGKHTVGRPRRGLSAHDPADQPLQYTT